MRKKFTMLLASLFLTVGTAWAQNVVTSTEENPVYYTIASYDRGGVITYSDVDGAVAQHTTYSAEGKSTWYFEAVPGNQDGGVYIVSKNKTTDGEKIYLGSDRKASVTSAVWYILKHQYTDLGYAISSLKEISGDCCIDAGKPYLGSWYPKASTDWQGTTWVFVGDVQNATYNPNNWTMQAGTGGRKISSITVNGVTKSIATSILNFMYLDHTKNIEFTVIAESEVAISITDTGDWMHAYAYVDVDNDGFTEEDAVAYSYCDGKDSDGTAIGTADNAHNTLVMPSFTAPSTPGTYRLRVKNDWDNLNPNGTEGKIDVAGGQFVDVTLVVSPKDSYLFAAPAGCTITYGENEYTDGDAFVPNGELVAGDFAVSGVPGGYVAVVEIDDESNTVTITYDLNLQAGDKLILKNKQHNRYMGVMLEGGELDGDPVPTTKKLASTSSYDYKNVWELVAATHNEVACFYIYNPYYDWYASPITTRNVAVLLSKDSEGAGCYQIETQGDYIVFKCLNGATDYAYLHQVDWGNYSVVDWNASADASQWSFELVSSDSEEGWLTALTTEFTTLKTTLSNCPLGSEVGLYSGMTEEEKTAANEALVVPTEGTVVEKIKAAVNALYVHQPKINSLTLNAPATDRYYRLKNEASGNYMSGNKSNITLLADGAEVVSTIFYLGADKSLRAINGKYLDCNAKGYANAALSGAFGPAADGAKAGVVTYRNNNYWTYGAGGDGASLDRGSGTPSANGYNWTFEEADPSTVYEEMQKLSALVAEASDSLGVLPLQVSDNTAANYLSSCGSADGNVEGNMIDGSNSTFYGSPWRSSVNGIDYHYWQVDLGDGVSLSEFVFSYVTRSNGNDMPTEIVVKGSANGENFEVIENISSGLPAAASTSYTSDILSGGNYRYLRFEVKGTNNNYAAGSHATQKTIAIAEFSIARRGSSLSTNESAVLSEVESAQAILDNVYTQSANDAVESIGGAYATLKSAYTDLRLVDVEKPVYPFEITTDVETPVLYAIKSGRTNDSKEWWYTYDSDDGKIALKQYTGENTQLWFFKEVVTEDYQYALQLYPYADKAKAMSYQNTASAVGTIVAQAPGTAGWTNYWLLAATNGAAPYGLQTYDKANYLSNMNGVSYKMGMWTATPANDRGTAMYISSCVEVTQAVIDRAVAMCSGEGTAVGYYTAASIDALELAIATARENLANGNYVITDLNDAMAAVEVVLPEAGKYYQIVSGLQAFAETKAIYSTGEALAWKTLDPADKAFYWTITPNQEGTSFTFRNEKEGTENCYMNGLTMVAADTVTSTLKSLAPGEFNVISNGGDALHASGHTNGAGVSGSIIKYSGGANSASSWRIIEVEHPDLATAKGALQNKIDELQAKMAPAVQGTNPGYYRADQTTQLSEPIAEARTVLEGGSAVPTDYTDALAALNAGIASLDLEPIPVTEGLYRIVSAATAFAEEKSMTLYAYNTTSQQKHCNPGWAASDENDPKQYWTLEAAPEGKFYIKGADGSYIAAATSTDATDKKEAEFIGLGEAQFNIKLSGDDNPLHCIGWNWTNNNEAPLTTFAGDKDSPSAWKLIKLTEEPTFTYDLTVTEVGYATLMLGFDATIPVGVECYTVAVDAEGYADMTLVEGGTLPANTPVIVKAVGGTYTFSSSAVPAAAGENTNELKGSLYPKFITPDANTTCYVLANIGDRMGFHKATLNQNANTAFLNNANKVYLVVDTPAEQAARALVMRFGKENGTTSIDNGQLTIDNGQLTIYDLQGRRVLNPTKGMYIVNGKKVLF